MGAVGGDLEQGKGEFEVRFSPDSESIYIVWVCNAGGRDKWKPGLYLPFYSLSQKEQEVEGLQS